jgi:hypothetical protein
MSTRGSTYGAMPT